MFDTHCHLNFKRFKKNTDEVIKASQQAGVRYFVVPGTDIKTSKKAVDIAKRYKDIYAAVGIHPHHVYRLRSKGQEDDIEPLIKRLEGLLANPEVVAIGEVGVDTHIYAETVYKTYRVDNVFIKLQEEILRKQIKLAIQYNKSLILHNREAADNLISVLNKSWDRPLAFRTVFHCCEPDEKLLEFAKQNNIFIGVDGDITYNKEKQAFIKEVPLNLLVLETDSPFILPEPLRSQRAYPNTPANLGIIAKYVAEVKNKDINYIIKQTTKNGLRLFSLEG